jgi:hypothetical protein
MDAILLILTVLSSEPSSEGPVQEGGKQGVELGGGLDLQALQGGQRGGELGLGGDRMHRISRIKARIAGRRWTPSC